MLRSTGLAYLSTRWWNLSSRALVLVLWLVPHMSEAQSRQLQPPSCTQCRWRIGTELQMPALSSGATWIGRPGGLVVEPDGEVWVSDLARHQLVRLSRSSTELQRIGREGSGPGEFRSPSLLALSGSTIYVLDVALSRISVFSSGGNFLRSFPMPVRVPAPKGMVADDHGNLYLSGMAGGEPGRGHVIHQIDSLGRHVRSFGAQGEAFKELGDAIYGDGGPLYWDSGSRTLWFARSGPRFELIRYRTDGSVLSMVSQALESADADPAAITVHGGSMSLRPNTLLGAYAIVPFDSLVVVASRIDSSGRVRYNAFRRVTAHHLAQWEAPGSLRGGIVAGDGAATVYVVRVDEEMPIRFADVSWRQ